MNGSSIDDARADAFFQWAPEPYCLGCRHYRSINGHGAPRRGLVCHYLLDTGEARGCPFGSGCIHRCIHR